MLFGDDTRNGRPGKHNAERSFLTNNAENNMDAQTPDCKNGSKLCCSDAFPHCEILGKSYCAEIYMQPDSWYFENCRKYCGWCGIDPKEFQHTSTTNQTTTTVQQGLSQYKNRERSGKMAASIPVAARTQRLTATDVHRCAQRINSFLLLVVR